MSNALKLKKKAADLEQKRQFDKALALYIQVLEEASEEEQAQEVNLYNRVGDLLVRQGNVAEACNYYEKAVDLYAEGGFFNNAIALCNKILRTAPGRNSVYYKLGKISAKKGFKSDARQNFLEYADRMQKAGKMDEAFRALKEFADLSPDQDDIRLMLADMLSKKGRRGEAVDQLQQLYDKLQSEGRSSEAKATLERMQAIEPGAEPKASEAAPASGRSNDLVFLDLSSDTPPSSAAAPAPRAEPPRADRPLPAPAASATSDLPFLDTADAPVGGGAASDAAIGGAAPAGREAALSAPDPSAAREGQDLGLMNSDASFVASDAGAGAPDANLISADFVGGDFEATAVGAGGLDGFQSSDFGTMNFSSSLDSSPLEGGGDLLGLDRSPLDDSDRGEVAGLLDIEAPISQNPPLATSEFDALALDAAPTAERSAAPPAHDLALPGELPLIDLPHNEALAAELPMLDVEAPAESGSVSGTDISPPELDVAARTGVPPIGTPVTIRTGDIDPAEAAAARHMPQAAPGSASAMVAQSAETLRTALERAPGDWGLRRRYAEALLESGDRDAGLRELDLALVGYERSGDLDAAGSVAEEIIRVDPSSVRHHQKRVEYAFRSNDKARLVDAYLELADALVRVGQADKSRTVYQRVLDLAPDDIRAQAAMSAFIDEPAAPAKSTPRRAPPSAPRTPAGRAAVEMGAAPAADLGGASDGADDDFVNLGDWLRQDEGRKSTRMVTEEREPTGDEQADFADMLRRFKQGVAENVEETDFASHYDLGVAYKEMGLLDEAIAEFQKALRSPELKVRTYEALGQCFIEKEQFQVAATILTRALSEKGVGDDQLVGVLYLLGFANEALGRKEDAVTYYQRVFAVDIQFRDVSDRLNALERAAR